MKSKNNCSTDKKTLSILCVSSTSSGSCKERSVNRPYECKELFLNYGLLGLATNLRKLGHDVTMAQSNGQSASKFMKHPEIGERLKKANILMLSVPTFYDVPFAMEFSREVRKHHPDVRIAIGGRWVFDQNSGWGAKKFDQAHMIIRGCPDDHLPHVLDRIMSIPKDAHCPMVTKCYTYSEVFNGLDYDLLFDFNTYQPIIEVSRGCVGTCNFCNEKHYSCCKLMSPERILCDAGQISQAYGTDDLNFYFEGAMLAPSTEWAREFRQAYQEKGMKFGWRFQSRVDCLNPEVIRILSGSGLKVIDLGLESASPKMLKLMGKTKNPEQYLQRAKKILDAADESGVRCKLNVLLYAGETLKTWNETMNWLRRMKKSHPVGFCGVSANPLAIYLNGEGTEGYVQEVEELSSCSLNRDELNENGFTTLRSSNDIPSLEGVACDAYRALMTEDEYRFLKSITYTPRCQD